VHARGRRRLRPVGYTVSAQADGTDECCGVSVRAWLSPVPIELGREGVQPHDFAWTHGLGDTQHLDLRRCAANIATHSARPSSGAAAFTGACWEAAVATLLSHAPRVAARSRHLRKAATTMSETTTARPAPPDPGWVQKGPDGSWGRHVDLITFRPDQDNSEYRIQRIEDAVGDLNLDYYACGISEMPPGVAPADLARDIRQNLDSFTGELAHFEPIDAATKDKWESSDPVGATIHIDMGVGWGNIEDGSVVCSRADETSWVFSTVDVPYEDWEHPVSGQREFGVTPRSDGGYEFYTMGADRPTGYIDDAFSSKVFGKADELWREVMNNVCDDVNKRGGKARVLPGSSVQIPWKKAWKEIIKPLGGRDAFKANKNMNKYERRLNRWKKRRLQVRASSRPAEGTVAAPRR